jgi:hypothetical protein
VSAAAPTAPPALPAATHCRPGSDPTLLATSATEGILSFNADDQFVYWATGVRGDDTSARMSSFFKSERSASHGPQPVASMRGDAVAIVIGREHIFAAIGEWVNVDGSFSLFALPKDGGTPTMLSTGWRDIWSLRSDGRFVYFIGVKTGEAERLVRLPLEGGDVAVLVEFPTVISSGIGMDDTAVYWVEGRAGDLRMMSVPKSGGAAVEIARLDADPWGFVVDGGFAYAMVPGKIERYPTRDGAREDVIAHKDFGTTLAAMAVERGVVYAKVSGDPLMRVDRPGGGSVALYRSLPFARFIVRGDDAFVASDVGGAYLDGVPHSLLKLACVAP